MIILIRIVHRSSHLSWIGWPVLQEIGAKGVQVVVPAATGEIGRPDLHTLMKRLMTKEGKRDRIAVAGSGPDSMGRTARNTRCGNGTGWMEHWRCDREIWVVDYTRRD